MLADEVAVALAPADTYARLVTRVPALTWWQALERPAIVLLVFGTVSAITATGRVTATLVASTVLLWAWAPLVQLVVGVGLVLASPRRRVAVPAAIDLLFTGHLPWTLWVVVSGAWFAASAPFGVELAALAAVAAVAGNARVLFAFNRQVLGEESPGASVRLLLHQAAIWAVGLWFVAHISGGWFRLVNP
jgi:hypothetical protein